MKKVMLTSFAVFSLSQCSLSQNAAARPARINQIPNGREAQCLTCHTMPFGGARNAFGMLVHTNLDEPGPAGVVQWSQTLAGVDSDGDGATNGQELGDPMGDWQQGQADPPGPVSNPGDPASTIPSPDAGMPDAGQSPDAGMQGPSDDEGGCQNIGGRMLTWLFFALGLAVWLGRRRPTVAQSAKSARS